MELAAALPGVAPAHNEAVGVVLYLLFVAVLIGGGAFRARARSRDRARRPKRPRRPPPRGGGWGR